MSQRPIIIRRQDALDAIEAYRRKLEPIPPATQAAADLVISGARRTEPKPRHVRKAKAT